MNETQTLLRALVDLRDRTLQKSRIAFGNRAGAVERGEDTSTAEPGDEREKVFEAWQTRFDDLETAAEQDIAELTASFPIIEQMTRVKGVGKLLAAKVVAMVDIERADTVSALWRFAGYAVIDGKAERPTKGEKLHYNRRLKTACYLVGVSFLRSSSPYRLVYDETRATYETSHPDWSDGHKHQAALRRMLKVWLAHLWERWRKMEGLSTRPPYILEHGHTTYMEPEAFGWGPA